MAFTGPMEDRLAIRELIEAYADAVTRLDAQAWGATWAEDGTWAMPDYPEFPTQHGRDAIVALWVEAMKHYPGIMFEAWPGSIEVDGSNAIVRCYTSEVYDQEGFHQARSRCFEDICVKKNGEWLFLSRTFRNIHRQQAPKGC